MAIRRVSRWLPFAFQTLDSSLKGVLFASAGDVRPETRCHLLSHVDAAGAEAAAAAVRGLCRPLPQPARNRRRLQTG